MHVDLLSSDVAFPKKLPRLQIVPQVVSDTSTDSAGFVIATVETFDATTGRTHVFVNAAVPRLGLLAP